MPKPSSFNLKIAGIPFRFCTKGVVSDRLLHHYITEEEPVNDVPITVQEKYCKSFYLGTDLNDITSDQEFFLLHLGVSNALLEYKRCLFHGVAFIFQGKAFIFTAPSGTGKSTQFKHWKMLYGNDVQIINGDKPILEFHTDKTVVVHPSPWNGKENFHGFQSAPLGGIIYLEQGKENKITRMKPQEAVIPIYKQFLFLPETGEAIHAVCQLENVLLRNIPVWKLVNLGDAASARLTHDVLLKYLEK